MATHETMAGRHKHGRHRSYHPSQAQPQAACGHSADLHLCMLRAVAALPNPPLTNHVWNQMQPLQDPSPSPNEMSPAPLLCEGLQNSCNRNDRDVCRINTIT